MKCGICSWEVSGCEYCGKKLSVDDNLVCLDGDRHYCSEKCMVHDLIQTAVHTKVVPSEEKV